MTVAEIEKKLKRFSVGIAGAGGLGSNCAASLARCGIGTLIISDFDNVEEKNLSRQFYFRNQVGMPKTAALKENLLRIRPDLNVEIHTGRIDRKNIGEIFSGCDVIVEAFDRSDMKEMFIEQVQQNMPLVPLIVGSGMAGWGNCNRIRCRKLDDSLYVCGDESSEISDELPPLAPGVGIVANMQADVVLEILLNKT
ncbi:MAG: sulfur carrier protein ThiS adenylyltransferase ThiF [Bacteroidales bacterium]